MVKRLTHREWVAILLAQGSTILCFRCKQPITSADDCEREHIVEKGLGGTDEAKYARISHVACHKKVTHGTPATRAGSSRHRIAKTQGTRAEKFAVNKIAVDKPREQKRRFGWAR